MPCASARRSTSAAMGAGSRTGPTSSCSTRRPETAPLSPATWSAWKWVRTTASRVVTPSRRRQPSTSGGSGPVSTRTARCGPLRSDDGVPLAHVAHDDAPPLRGPGHGSGGNERGGREEDGCEEEHGVARRRADDGPPGEDDGQAERREEQGAGCTVGPRQRATGHAGEPAGELRDRRGRDDAGPRDELGAARPHHRGEGGGHPGDGRHRHERRREEVREDTDDADRPLEEDDERGGHQLRREGHGERGPEGCEAPRKPVTDGVAPGPGEEEEAERRHRGQREAEGPGQPRVEHQHDDDRRAQHREPGGPARAAQAEQPDRPHGGGPQDAGLRAGEDDEAGQGHEGQNGSRAPRHAEQDAQAEDEPGDDGDVAAAHGGQVRHPGRAHRLGEVGRRAARVTDDETREQPSGVRGRGVDRRPQPGPQPLCTGRHGPGRA